MSSIREFLAETRRRHVADWVGVTPAQRAAGAVTVDSWRHDRMLGCALPLLEAAPGSAWLTVGDGRHGDDARFLNEHGGKALATDLDTALLEKAAAAGRIKEYRALDAEQMDLADDAVDYVLCKESFHHFARPWHAFHEMLRVARQAVVLIEPQDRAIHASLGNALGALIKNALRALLGAGASPHQFEESGNYVYSLSRIELEKAALAVNRRHLYFRALNVLYLPRLADQPAGSAGFRLFGAITALLDLLSAIGLWRANILAAVVFKNTPPPAADAALRRAGFRRVILPANPYIGSTHQ